MRLRTPLGRTALAVAIAAFTLVPMLARPSVGRAAGCTPTTGPGIPPPASVPSGIPGFHASWYGQSGYPTLCPGQTSRAVVAFYNSGSFGWRFAPQSVAYLGTWGPSPGQDRASILGGNGTHASPDTRWPEFNRPAVMPVGYVGPNQVAWFQFTVKAPTVPGTYRLYIRPVIEGATWLEDFGVFWQVTVVSAATPPQRVTVRSVDLVANSFGDGTSQYRYDRNDGFEYGDGTVDIEEFEQLLRIGAVLDVRYETAEAERSTFDIVDMPPFGPPPIALQRGSYDRGMTENDIRVDVTPPASAGSQRPLYRLQRALVTAGTGACTVTSGPYEGIYDPEGLADTLFDLDVAAGTYCYRAGSSLLNGQTAWGYSAPLTLTASPAPVPGAPAPISLDARVFPDAGAVGVLDQGDRLKIAFDGPMSLCDDVVVRLRDEDGTVVELSRAVLNVDCSRNSSTEYYGARAWPPYTVITLLVGAAPTIVAPGATNGLQLPARVISSSGVRSDLGLGWDIDRSVDVVLATPD